MDSLVTLDRHMNNVGISFPECTSAGKFNVWGNSFAGNFLPKGGEVTVHGVPFDFPHDRRGHPDNVRCAGQYIDVEPGNYDWIYLLTAAERRAEDELALHFSDGQVDFEALRVSDFWDAPAAFGERRAFASPVMHYPHHVQAGLAAVLWQQRVPVARRGTLIGIRLPKNISIHIFSATLRATQDPGQGDFS